jgi:hypothetical protein
LAAPHPAAADKKEQETKKSTSDERIKNHHGTEIEI